MKIRPLSFILILGLAVSLPAETPTAPVKPATKTEFTDSVKQISELQAKLLDLTKEKETLTTQLAGMQASINILRQQRNEIAAQLLDATGQVALLQHALQDATPKPAPAAETTK